MAPELPAPRSAVPFSQLLIQAGSVRSSRWTSTTARRKLLFGPRGFGRRLAGLDCDWMPMDVDLAGVSPAGVWL